MLLDRKVGTVVDFLNLCALYTAGGLQVWEDQHQQGNVQFVACLDWSVTAPRVPARNDGDAPSVGLARSGLGQTKRNWRSFKASSLGYTALIGKPISMVRSLAARLGLPLPGAGMCRSQGPLSPVRYTNRSSLTGLTWHTTGVS